jgi:predicted transcriptional regulator
MPKQAAFTVEPEPDLRDALIAEAEVIDRPPSHVVRDLIDDFVRQQSDAREHDAWFRAEVEQGLREADDPTVKRIPNEEVEASWERKRAELIRRIGGQGLES